MSIIHRLMLMGEVEAYVGDMQRSKYPIAVSSMRFGSSLVDIWENAEVCAEETRLRVLNREHFINAQIWAVPLMKDSMDEEVFTREAFSKLVWDAEDDKTWEEAIGELDLDVEPLPDVEEEPEEEAWDNKDEDW